MTTVMVLGSDPVSCTATVRLIEQVAAERGVEVRVVVLEGFGDQMAYGVMDTPGVVIDGVVMHMGGIPARERVERWFA